MIVLASSPAAKTK